MDCERLRNRFIDYIEGETSPLFRALIEAHLDRCYTCREELEDLRDLLATCRRALRHPCPRSQFAAIRERMAEPAAPSSLVKALERLRQPKLGYALATAAALVGIMWATFPMRQSTRQLVAPLQSDSAAFQEWVRSDRPVAPIVSRQFVARRVLIEEESQM